MKGRRVASIRILKFYIICAIFWQLAPTNILHMEISEKKGSSKSGDFGTFIFHKNPLYELDTRFFLVRRKKLKKFKVFKKMLGVCTLASIVQTIEVIMY